MGEFIFYWTPDDDTGAGVKCYVKTEEARGNILQHYFEASMEPVEGVKYQREPILYPGVMFSGAARCI